MTRKMSVERALAIFGAKLAFALADANPVKCPHCGRPNCPNPYHQH